MAQAFGEGQVDLRFHVNLRDARQTILDRLFDRPAPYISAWHQAPVRRGGDDFALHLELFTVMRAPGKLKYLAGSESGMGAFANDIAPEAAADRLRRLG
jgi:UDPglucose--hexose-1-phosphate uridylyltransferase